MTTPEEAKRKTLKKTKRKSPTVEIEEGQTTLPGPMSVADTLMSKIRFHSIRQEGTNFEKIWFYNGQIYEPAEERIRTDAHSEFMDRWTELAESTDHDTAEAARRFLTKGPTRAQLEEVTDIIRRLNFTPAAYMNPDTHIPFKDGLLSLKTWDLEPFTPDLFFTYQIQANLLSNHVTLADTPKFSNYLRGVFFPYDIPMVLSYFAYSMQPSFPIHKVLLILGRERVGKGTGMRIMRGLIGKGYGPIQLSKLLTAERFMFSGIEGKNLLVDAETKRTYKHGAVIDWSAFTNLFGGDTIAFEPKGREQQDFISKAKGIFVGNLPFFPVTNRAALSRILPVRTRNNPPLKVVPNLETLILESERDAIATLLVQVLRGLEKRNYLFPGEMTIDGVDDLLMLLADPVEFFIEEKTEFDENSSTLVDEAYKAFVEWCAREGIPAMSKHVFVDKFKRTYPKKRMGTRGNQVYFFTGCDMIDTDEDDRYGYGRNATETTNYTVSYARYPRIHFFSPTSRMEGEGSEYCNTCKGKGADMVTCINASGDRVNKPPAEKKSVSISNDISKISFGIAPKDQDAKEPLLQSYIVLKQFSHDSALYEAGMTLERNPNDFFTRSWINDGKIAPRDHGKDVNSPNHDISPDSPGANDVVGDPTNEEDSTKRTELKPLDNDELVNKVVHIIKHEEAGMQYHSLTEKDVFNFMPDGPFKSLELIKKAIKEAYNKGFLMRKGRGWAFND